MKSKVSVLMIAMLSALAAWQADVVFDDGPSYREQLIQVMSLRDSGFISSTEARSAKKRIFSLMMH